MNTEVEIITATSDDVVPVAKILVDQFHSEYKNEFPAVDVKKTIEYIGNHYHEGKIFIVKRGQDIVGVTMAKPVAFWFSHEKYVNEGVFYVAPSARRSRAAKLLTTELKAYARKLDLPLMLGISSGDRVKAKDRFFENQGFKRIGGLYLCAVETQPKQQFNHQKSQSG